MAHFNTNPTLHSAASLQSLQSYDSNSSSAAASSSAASEGPRKLYVTLDEFVAHQPSSRVNHRIIVGAGPRGTAQVTEDLLFMLEHKEDFDKLGQKPGYRMETTLIERKGKDWVARGNGWGPDQGVGTVNTSPEKAQFHKERISELLKKNRDTLGAKYAEKNPIAHAALQTAFQDPEGTDENPTTGRASLTRTDQGQEEQEYFTALCELAHQTFPFLKINVITETSVDKIDVSDPENPRVLVRANGKSSPLVALAARGVVLNTGTTVKNPISDPEVQKHTFAEPMNQERLASFLDAKGLLDANGELKQGAKLLVGGTGLSLYDQLIALHGSMKLMEVDETAPFGYKLTEAAKEKYQGALTVVSFTPGKWISPRHTNSAEWTQEKKPLGTAEELHSMFLHEDGQEVYKTFADLAIASVAATLGLTPEQVHQNGLTTEALLKEQGDSTLKHMEKLAQATTLTGPAREQALKEATWTLEGARRQAYLPMILGYGATENPEATIARMNELAPLTFKGRAGYLMERAQPAGVTTAEVATGRGNREEMNVLTTLTNDITASPFRVHYFAVMLQQAGIVKYEPGSYNDFKAKPGDNQLEFKGREMDAPAKFDAFVVSPTFDRKAEPALTSLAGQVKSVHKDVADLPELTGNRLMLRPDSVNSQEGRLPIQDFGYNGAGAMLGRNKVGLVSYDVNNRDSAYDVSPGLTLRRMAQEHLFAAGLTGAFNVVEGMYDEEAEIDADAFRAEVSKFADAFESGQKKTAFVKSVEKAVKEDPAALKKGDTFAGLAHLFATSKLGVDAAAVVAKHMANDPDKFGVADDERMRAFVAAGVEYDGKKGSLPKFNPASQEKLFARFVDYPLHIHQAVYARAKAFAEETPAKTLRHTTPRR
ncbi:hypothetical protein [Herbaspirillum sp. SJZ099]|uniref:hypothetical protein n=1 Tax=Herbaspirillum sp. SJZ099 TaxID=2572916 RepID=UPI00119F0F39|nr:hypothetical protein [Herbaspirillum sp. SJZ099]TWC67347.1 hypothetical protein FB597_104157 [Herbaspirillum sp. SJZ099]